MKRNTVQKGNLNKLSYYNNLVKYLMLLFVVIMLPSLVFAQDPFYYHTKSSHGLSLVGGRTAKISYLYQMAHTRQFKLSCTWFRDTYESNGNQITSNAYSLDLQLQYNLIHFGRFFINGSFGFGGYYLQAKDVFNNKSDEWRFNFVAGGEVEFYLIRNSIALTFDYDVLITPWSKVYDFIHVPVAGVTFYFF